MGSFYREGKQAQKGVDSGPHEHMGQKWRNDHFQGRECSKGALELASWRSQEAAGPPTLQPRANINSASPFLRFLRPQRVGLAESPRPSDTRLFQSLTQILLGSASWSLCSTEVKPREEPGAQLPGWAEVGWLCGRWVSDHGSEGQLQITGQLQ